MLCFVFKTFVWGWGGVDGGCVCYTSVEVRGQPTAEVCSAVSLAGKCFSHRAAIWSALSLL